MGPLRAIVGPTAAGKSAIAMSLAGRHGAAIVSADSRQVYRGFDIGTAKPSADEQRRVPHYGVDVADPEERYSAARFADDARGWIDDAAARGLTPLVVGGTGFYVRALVEPLASAPELGGALDPRRRAALGAFLDAMSFGELARWVATLDPARAHLGRTQLVRAIETALLTGRRLSDLHAASAPSPAIEASYLVVDPGREVLARRIEDRVDAMLAAGWLDEVRRLASSVPPGAPAWTGTGYDALRRHVGGEITLDEARREVIVATRQYAKRQRTWFRHQLPEDRVTRLDPLAPDAGDRLAAWWRGAAPASLRATPPGDEDAT
ncbi:MAG TPA: tRNA (adenosine(37)-N6)-dimethylallyltransferase MiaA [Gemmatimonadales bacterium]